MPLQPNVTYSGNASPLFLLAGATAFGPTGTTSGAFKVITGATGGFAILEGTTGYAGLRLNNGAGETYLTSVAAPDGDLTVFSGAFGGGVNPILEYSVANQNEVHAFPIVAADGVQTTAINLVGAPAAGVYGKATITGAGNLVVANTGITAGAIIMVTPQSATAVASPLRITVTPATGFTIFNDNVGSVTAMYAVLSLDGAA
jgi:hypothetical protein